MRRKLLIAAVLVLACGVLAVEFYPVHVLIWDGGYKLTVHIDTLAGPPSAVGCYVVGRREHAEEHIALLRGRPQSTRLATWIDDGVGGTISDPFVGEPLKVRVGVSGRQSLFGREVARSQHQALVVGAEWPDGRSTWKVVEIPDGRESREVRVSLP